MLLFWSFIFSVSYICIENVYILKKENRKRHIVPYGIANFIFKKRNFYTKVVILSYTVLALFIGAVFVFLFYISLKFSPIIALVFAVINVFVFYYLITYLLNKNKVFQLLASYITHVIIVLTLPITSFIYLLSYIFYLLIPNKNIEQNTHSFIHNTDQEDQQIEIFKNAIDFSSVKLKECVIPRTELVTVEISDSIEDLNLKFIQTGYSKIIVYKDSIDNVLGYVHNADMFHKPSCVKDILRPIVYVPETMYAKKVLAELIQNKQSIALVVDEFGGTAGVVALEDIIEEIFGEIKDEYDSSNILEKAISDSEFVFSARQEVDYINKKFKLNLPVSPEYETLAGLFLYKYKTFPRIKAFIQVNSLKITILKLSETRIELVHVKKI